MSEYFILYGNCTVTKGYTRSIICDLYLNRFYYIPNEMNDLLLLCRTNPYQHVFNTLNDESKIVFRDYLNYFTQNNLGFYTTEPEKFPPITLDWKEPSKILTSIIDVNPQLDNSLKFYKEFINELSCLNCKLVELRFQDLIKNNYLEEWLYFFENTRIRNICIFVKYCPEIAFNLSEITKKFKRIIHISLFDSPNENYSILNNVSIECKIEEDISPISCGNIVMENFLPSIKHYTEAQKHSTCLNRKISIGYDGQIKNCPSCIKSFGDFRQTTIGEVIELSEFKSKWNINKDVVNICKDCEYRYICMDCRAYLEDPEDKFSKPLKCGYNPYTGEWGDWKRSKENILSMEFYGF